MEGMEAKALRPSLRGELAQFELFDEIYCSTTNINNGAGLSCVPSEDFSIDELLNLQNGEFEDGSVEEEEEEEEKYSLCVDEESLNVSGGFTGAGDSESALTSELAVLDDDLAELEWVSHFVDDSFSDFSLLHPIGKQRTELHSENRFEQPEPTRTGTSPTCFPSVPVKTRTKRARPTTQSWSRSNSLSPLTESSTSSSSSVASSPSSASFSSTPCLIFTNTVQAVEFLPSLSEPASKKQKKKPAVQTGAAPVGPQFQRRCSHCLVQKTPQWRTGPLGPKTLCNACGVRFKSGRLFPEYRPACSPTFSSEVHSNSHRKVLEMRKKKEVVGPGSGSGLTHVISSF
ncbi:GATA transcription factor 5-like [Humulus lupulus]|uniref:GATA transcription factor 5-like n=1 Tax=Humulus lupulus TaxID=3486 RepID=UPI002B400FBD|nr:GATA transcription factor 5-like [Humulus lupulus]